VNAITPLPLCVIAKAVGQVAQDSSATLLLHLASVGIDDEIGHACSWGSVPLDDETGVETGPQLAIRKDDLLHARVVAVDQLFRIRERSGSPNNQLPAADNARRNHQAGI